MKYEEIRKNLENPNDEQVCDWLENNTLTLNNFFKASEKEMAHAKENSFGFDFYLFMYPEYKTYKLIYGLFNRLKPTPKNAEIIHYIFKKIPYALIYAFISELKITPVIDEDTIPDLLKKWKNKKQVKHADYLYYYKKKIAMTLHATANSIE